MKCDIVENITQGTVIECDPGIVYDRHDGKIYTSIAEDDNVRILNTSLPLLTFSDLECKIGDILSTDPYDFTNTTKLYFLEGVVIDQPDVIQSYIHGTTVSAISTYIGGEGGSIMLLGHIRDNVTVSEGDSLRIVGAAAIPKVIYSDEVIRSHPSGWIEDGIEETEDLELRLSPYGSLIKLDLRK